MAKRSTTRVQTIGVISKLQEKTASNGSKFFIIDLVPITGYPLRIQAWDDAYNYIKKNQIHGPQDGVGGDIIFADCYYHTYSLNIHGEDTKMVTFKADKISRPGSQFISTGTVTEIECEDVETNTSDTFTFKFKPDCPGNPNDIHCCIDKTNRAVPYLQEGFKCTIIGDVDNRDKKIFKTYVDSVTDYEITEPSFEQWQEKDWKEQLEQIRQMAGVDQYGN